MPSWRWTTPAASCPSSRRRGLRPSGEKATESTQLEKPPSGAWAGAGGPRRCHCEEPHDIVLAPRGQEPAVRAEGERGELGATRPADDTARSCPGRQTSRVPLGAGGGEEPAVRAVAHRLQRCAAGAWTTPARTGRLGRGEVPLAHAAVIAGRRQRPPAGAKGHVVNGAGEAPQCGQARWVARVGQVEECHRPARPARRQQAAVRAERHRVGLGRRARHP